MKVRNAPCRPRLAARLLTAAALIILIGCGPGLNLTGGSIPIGSARLQGIVVRADNVSKTVSGAWVVLKLGNLRSDRTAGSDGRFDFGSIPGGAFIGSAQTGLPSDLTVNWNWPFDLPENTDAFMVIALWPTSFQPSQIDHIGLTPPPTMPLQVGQSTHFTATVYDKNNQALPVQPSWLLEGDIGTLEADGTFRATRAGSGRITAWMPGYSVYTRIDVVEAVP